jgi:catechol 2,3-dioxygenase-like lactoylglutathione lyase family enzyme
MLDDKQAHATVAVKDLAVAGKFYEAVLGLKRTEVQQPGVLSYQTGSSRLLVYPSQFAGTNQATAVTWTIGGDLERVVEGLKAKGVTFEHYDFPGSTRQGDVHVMGKQKAAWFKDPDGNILALIGG